MRYFKTPNKETYAIEPGQEFLIKNDWKEISEQEATAFSPEQLKLMRIAELKANLAETDYRVLPDYDKPDDGIRTQRQAWREEIRKLGG
jgi:hypothetical protein